MGRRSRLALRDGAGHVVVDLELRPDLIEDLKHGDIRHFLKKARREGWYRRIRLPPGVKREAEGPGRVARARAVPGLVRVWLAMIHGPDYPLWVKPKRARKE